jgi:hypothetical protein
MDNYKGIYYGQTTETKSFEGGAHFKYKDLYHALLSLYNSLSQDKVGTALHYYASTTELKPTRTRNALVSFNNLPMHHLKTENDTTTTTNNKEVVPIINVKHTTSSSNNILNAHSNNNTDYNDKRTRNKNLLIQANPNTKITGCGGSSSNSNNVHQRKKSACVVNNDNTYIKYTKHNNTNNNSDNINNVIYKVKKKTPLILTTEGNNNNTTTESQQHIITSGNNNYAPNKRLIKPKIKSIKYQLHHAPFVNVVPNEFCKNNSLYSILKKQEQTEPDTNNTNNNNNNTTTTHNRNSFQLNIKKQLNYKFKNNYSLSKSNNKSNIINISNHNTESTNNNNNAISIQTYFYKDKKSRNERMNKQNIMFPSSSKCFHTSTTYNQRMLRDMYQSHIQNMRKQMITNHSQSKSKEKRNTNNNNNNHSSAIKYFHNHSLTHLKHVNKVNPQQQSIAHYSLYQRSAIDLGNRSKLHSNNTHQGSYFKYRKSNIQKLLSTMKK